MQRFSSDRGKNTTYSILKMAQLPSYSLLFRGMKMISAIIMLGFVLANCAGAQHNSRGLRLLDKGELDEAIAEFRKTIQANPSWFGAYANLAMALRRKGNVQVAIKQAHKAVELGPNEVNAHYTLARTLLDGYQLQEAATEAKKAIHLNPTNADSYNLLGAIFVDQKRFGEARKAFEKAISLDSGSAMYQKNLRIVEMKLSLEEAMQKATQTGTKYIAQPDLQIISNFSDQNSFLPNNILDAGERAIIRLKITNRGKGIAFDTVAHTETNFQGITLSPKVPIGDIEPGKTKEMILKIRADRGIISGTMALKIICSENRGYGAAMTLNIPVCHLKSPKLVMRDYRINDEENEQCHGNGNGRPESGETIELVMRLENVGEGTANNPVLSVKTETPNISILSNRLSSHRLRPAQTLTSRILVAISRNFTGNKIIIQVKGSDERGITICNKSVEIKARAIFPVLSCSYRIFDKNGKKINSGSGEYIENGNSGRIELCITNKGEAQARDVGIEVHSDKLFFRKKQEQIGSLEPGAKDKPRIFEFQIPRALGTDVARVRIRVTQKDFPGLEKSIDIPHRPFTP